MNFSTDMELHAVKRSDFNGGEVPSSQSPTRVRLSKSVIKDKSKGGKDFFTSLFVCLFVYSFVCLFICRE